MITPEKRFKDDFMMVMNHYECSKEESRIERDFALANESQYYQVAKSYSIIAAGIRGLK